MMMDEDEPLPPALLHMLERGLERFAEDQVEEDEYFESYDDLEVHKLMLEDGPRVTAYKDAILKKTEYFKDKIVMDVGCGTGILSIFCAMAGAKKVFAVEASNMAKMAQKIVDKNGYSDVIEGCRGGPIVISSRSDKYLQRYDDKRLKLATETDSRGKEVIHSKVEDVVLTGDLKVDAIVSEWMGFYLLHEGMLDSVIAARDKFLKPDGKMFPESAVIYVAPCRVPKLNQFWKDFEGIDMSSFARHLRLQKQSKPEIMTIASEDLMGHEEALCWVNLTEDKVSDLDSYSLQHVVGANKEGHFQGLCIWFECNFPNGEVLDTSPKSPATHWQQTVIVLPQSNMVEDGEPMAYKLDMKRAEDNPRRYNLIMETLNADEVDHPIPCSCYMTKCILVNQLMTDHAEHAKEMKENASNQENSACTI